MGLPWYRGITGPYWPIHKLTPRRHFIKTDIKICNTSKLLKIWPYTGWIMGVLNMFKEFAYLYKLILIPMNALLYQFYDAHTDIARTCLKMFAGYLKFFNMSDEHANLNDSCWPLSYVWSWLEPHLVPKAWLNIKVSWLNIKVSALKIEGKLFNGTLKILMFWYKKISMLACSVCQRHFMGNDDLTWGYKTSIKHSLEFSSSIEWKSPE